MEAAATAALSANRKPGPEGDRDCRKWCSAAVSFSFRDVLKDGDSAARHVQTVPG